MKIIARKNGPFQVEGQCRLVDEDGLTPRAPGPPSSADLGEWEDEGGSVEPPPAPAQENDDARAHLRMHRLIR